MFSINSTPLDNDQYHWSVQSATKPYMGYTRRSIDLVRGDKSGNVMVPTSEDSPILSLVIRTPQAFLDTLMLLFGEQFHTIGYTSSDGRNGGQRYTTGEVMSMTPEAVDNYAENLNPLDLRWNSRGAAWVDLTVAIRLNNLYWKDGDWTVEQFQINNGNTYTFDLCRGATAPVRDLYFKMEGPFSRFWIEDNVGNSYFKYDGEDNFTGNYAMMFRASDGRAFRMFADDNYDFDPAGHTELTPNINNGPGPYYFEMRPKVDLTNPRCQIRVNVDNIGANTKLWVRSKRAYRV